MSFIIERGLIVLQSKADYSLVYQLLIAQMTNGKSIYIHIVELFVLWVP